MFAILPQTEDFIWEDAEYFTDKESAYDSAWDWSAELEGVTVNIYQQSMKGYNLISKVFA